MQLIDLILVKKIRQKLASLAEEADGGKITKLDYAPLGTGMGVRLPGVLGHRETRRSRLGEVKALVLRQGKTSDVAVDI